ncbi:MAG: hypothetical protein K2X57_06695 [Xanthobacteraceae bacterium]|nr:hypothetical protein [Xanthobacteraceae bacterium]
MNIATTLCQKPDCLVAQNGHCSLGMDPVEQCPNYAQAATQAETNVEPAPPSESTRVQPIEICSGDVMNIEELAIFSRRHRVRTVSLIGEHKAGKTTLIAAVYAKFCKGPVAGLQFAGSRTLVGFAKRHHLALVDSKRDEPTTPRTSRSEPAAFFHLAVRAEARGRPVHLIISDRSGEAYAAARTDTSLIEDLGELQFAERAVFILDGAKLSCRGQRAAYGRQFKQMIHAFHDNGALANARAIEILATKTDVTLSRPDTDDQTKYLDDYEQRLIAEFHSSGIKVGFHRICALPKSKLSVGYLGLDDVIERWAHPEQSLDVSQKAIPDAARQIDRLMTRW